MSICAIMSLPFFETDLIKKGLRPVSGMEHVPVPRLNLRPDEEGMKRRDFPDRAALLYLSAKSARDYSIVPASLNLLSQRLTARARSRSDKLVASV